MDRIEIIKTIKNVLKKHKIKRASLFGSFARKEPKYTDIDILIEPAGGFSLLDLVDVENILTKMLDKKVDLVTFNSLSPYLKPYVKKDLVVLYEGG